MSSGLACHIAPCVFIIGLLATTSAGALNIVPQSHDFDVTLFCNVGRGCDPPFPIYSAQGSIAVIELTQGVPVGGVVQGGSVGASDWTVVYQITIEESSGDENALGSFVYLLFPSGAMITGGGVIPGLGADLTTLYGDTFFPLVGTGESSDLIFQSFDSLSPGDTIYTAIYPSSSPSQGELGLFTVVPESSTLGLLLAGVVGLTCLQARGPH